MSDAPLSLQVNIVLSNCVVNLSPDKARVLAEAYRVLRAGGEFYFSDVYSDRRVSAEAQQDEVRISESHKLSTASAHPLTLGRYCTMQC